MDELPDMLTVDELAAWLRIGRRQAYEAVHRGDVPSIRLGHTIRIPRSALEDLVKGPSERHPDGPLSP